MTETILQIPPKTSPLWVNIATGKTTGEWKTLPVKLMMTRIRTQIERDSSPGHVSERAGEIYEFFEKNSKCAEVDLRILLG